MSREFWVSSGHHLCRRDERGRLSVTDELLTALFARPELAPPDEACAAERGLHAALLAAPRRPVACAELDVLADADARENWRCALAFRDRLVAGGTIEAAYLDLAQHGAGGMPPLFIDQLVNLILRNALDDCADPYVLRAAELFFRPQCVSVRDGAVLLADAEAVDEHERAAPGTPLARMLGTAPAPELDVITADNAWTYWSRSDAFTMALDLGSDPRARQALARAIECWVEHLLAIEIAVEPRARIADADWRWFVGLDAEATAIGNALWRGEPPAAEAQARVLALFALTFRDPARVSSRVGGSPVYLLLAMTPDRRVRLKPQNLIAGLPVAAA